MEEPEKDEAAPKKHGSSPKAETRLGPLLTHALKAYMRERHLTNESEILRSALGQMLEREGYLIRVGEEPGDYQVIEKPCEAPTPPPPKIGFRPSDLRSQPLILGLSKLARKTQAAASSHDGTREE